LPNHLTSTGQDELKRLTEIGFGRFAKFVENWDAEEVRSLARLLSKLEQSKGEVAQHESILVADAGNMIATE